MVNLLFLLCSTRRQCSCSQCLTGGIIWNNSWCVLSLIQHAHCLKDGETSDGLDMCILPHVTDPDLIIFLCFEALSIWRPRSVYTFIYTELPGKFPVTQESTAFQSVFRNILHARNVLRAARPSPFLCSRLFCFCCCVLKFCLSLHFWNLFILLLVTYYAFLEYPLSCDTFFHKLVIYYLC